MELAVAREKMEMDLVTVFSIFDCYQGFIESCIYGSQVSCLVFCKSNNLWLNIVRQLQKIVEL